MDGVSTHKNSMKTIHVMVLMAAEKSRKAGYADACRKAGQMNGEFVLLQDEDYYRLADEYALVKRPKAVQGGVPESGLKLGTAAHNLGLGQIGKALNLDCMERDAEGKATTILRADSGCAGRQARWDAAGQKAAAAVSNAVQAVKKIRKYI
jgi:hypothetical protein